MPYLLPTLFFLFFSIAVMASQEVERWGVFEILLSGPPDSPSFNAFDVVANATFSHATAEALTVAAFYDGQSRYLVRFSPPELGVWAWVTASDSPMMPQSHGFVTATVPSLNNHGPVIVDANASTFFRFADGSEHFSVGTTMYAWAHVNSSNAQTTLATLRGGPFNKLRMTLFPKFYPWTHSPPASPNFFAFMRASPPLPPPSPSKCFQSMNGTFDLTRFNPVFWQTIESYVRELMEEGIQVDIILFHPYDSGQYGFDCMPPTADAAYLRYAAARLGGFRNIWWSMANEWSDLKCKCAGKNSSECPETYFDALFEILTPADPHRRQRSIHNGPIYYNASRPWIDHISMQCHNASCVDFAHASWTPKPIVMDEIRYLGNITASWGQLTPEQMVQRFWMYFSKGVYAGHSETLLSEALTTICANPNDCDCDAIMWWNRGGVLSDFISPSAIAWFRNYVDTLPVPFNSLVSETLVPGVYWLHDAAATTYNLVLWDEDALSVVTSATIPLPNNTRFTLRHIDFMAQRLIPVNSTSDGGPLIFTPPTPGFLLELVILSPSTSTAQINI